MSSPEQRESNDTETAARIEVLKQLESLGDSFPHTEMHVGDTKRKELRPGFCIVSRTREYRRFGVPFTPLVATPLGVYEPEYQVEGSLSGGNGLHYLPVAESLDPSHEIGVDKYGEIKDQVIERVEQLRQTAEQQESQGSLLVGSFTLARE